jgi:hypothetical protein
VRRAQGDSDLKQIDSAHLNSENLSGWLSPAVGYLTPIASLTQSLRL